MTSLKMDAIRLWIWAVFIGLTLIFSGCAAPLNLELAKDANIKFMKSYSEITAEKWKRTEISVQKGETVIIVPLYPKGFLYSVQGKISEGGKPFEGLDVDLGDIYPAPANGVLYIGMDQKAATVPTGVFVFKTSNSDSILTDLDYLQKSNKDAKIINVTLGLLLKKRADRLLAQGRQQEALPVFDRSIGYLEQADEKLYSRTIYQLYREKAVIYKNSQEPEKYADSISKSFHALMRASEYYGELSRRHFDFLKALTMEERFILVTKTTYFEQIEVFERWLQRPGARQLLGSSAVDNLPHAYWRLCFHYTADGNLQLSLKYGEKAVEEANKTGNKEIIGLAYLYLANRHKRFGFYREAEESYIKALSLLTGMANVEAARINYAPLKADLGKFEDAVKMIEGVTMYVDEAIAGHNAARAYVYSRTKDHAKAIQISLWEINRLENLKGTWRDYVLGNLTGVLDSYAEAGSINDATHYFSVLKENISKRGNQPGLVLRYALALSKLNKRFGRDEIAPLQDAIASLETIRPTAASGKDYEYWENMLTVYDTTVDSLYRKAQYTLALNTVEKARSRRFLDDLGNKRLGAKGVSASLMIQRANETLGALAVLEADMMKAAEQSGIKVRSFYDKDSRLGKKMENCKAVLKQASDADQKFGVVANIVPVSVEQLQKLIPLDTTVVEYYQSEKELYIWVIDKNNITALRQDLSKDKLRKLIEQYRRSLYLDSTKRGIAIAEKETADFTALQREAYRLLITPVEKSIKTKKICIVPYDILNYLPFQSLHDGKRYLVEKYSLSYLPSLSVLEYLRKTQKKDRYTILAVGNPDLGDAKMDLPAAGAEVDMIREIFPQASVYKRGQATEAMVKKEAQRYDILHFAAHGEFKAADSLSSCLYLAPGGGEDGQLQVGEIFDMNINADMVVTSACQTALGKISRGDEVLGLTRAFIYAGANSVFGSLWSISDEATSILMKDFYANIKAMEMTEALRRAQMKMIRSKDYSHPYYWAAFNITGAL